MGVCEGLDIHTITACTLNVKDASVSTKQYLYFIATLCSELCLAIITTHTVLLSLAAYFFFSNLHTEHNHIIQRRYNLYLRVNS